MPHAQALAGHLPHQVSDLGLASLLGQAGFYLWVHGRHADAFTLEQRALAITQTALGPATPPPVTSPASKRPSKPVGGTVRHDGIGSRSPKSTRPSHRT